MSKKTISVFSSTLNRIIINLALITPLNYPSVTVSLRAAAADERIPSDGDGVCLGAPFSFLVAGTGRRGPE